MGSSNRPRDERPVHEVTLTKHYEIATYDVTQSPWYAVMKTTVGPDKGEGRSMRGGGWGNPARRQRSAHRTGNDERSRSSGGIGIRLIRKLAK